MEVQSQFIEMFGEYQYKEKLSSLCETFIDGDWIESKDQSEEGIRLVQTGNVGYGYFKDKEDKSRYISEDTFNRLHCTEIFAGDILVSRLPEPIGRACIVPKGIDRMITAVDCSIIRLKDVILPEYFISYTMTSTYCAQINEVTTGTTRRRVSRANLGNVLVPCPSIEAQRQFVAIFQQADKSKFVGFKSQFIEMLSNSGYEEKSLGELCDKMTDGSHNPPKGNDGSEYLMISSKNVFIDGLDLADVRYLSKDEFDLENKRTEVKKNDILLTIVGTIGRTYLVKGNEGNIVMQRSVAVLKPSDKVNPLFMMYSLHIDENLEKEGRGNAQKGVYLKQLSQFKIKVPSLDIQNNFCSIYQQAYKSKYYNQVA